jgi:DNA-binding transcriptional regulator GbsR (MarR family)
MPGRIGMSAYCLALAALPATAAEIAEASGFTRHGASDLMRSFWQLRLVTPTGIGYRDATIWSRGERAAYTKRVTGKGRPKANHIVFASMLRALEDACTTRELADKTGVSLCAAQTAIRHMRAAGIVYLAEWTPGSDSRPVARYEVGNKADVPKPAPQSNQFKWQLAQQRKAYRAIEGVAA